VGRIYRGTTYGDAAILLECRSGTHDEQTAIWLLDRDEYGLHRLGLPKRGTAIDIGAYTGAIAISLAIHGWKVIAVEPVPENQEMIARNLHLNNVQRRVRVEGRAASTADWIDIHYGYEGTHKYVGNLHGSGPKEIRVQGVTVSDLIERYGLRQVDLVKIDCEGCEWGVLRDTALAKIPRIVGEIHSRPQEALIDLLPQHHIEFITEFVFHAVLA